MRIQLDLHTKKVMYSDAKSGRRPLYEIQGSSKKAVQAQPPNRQSAGTSPPRQAPTVSGRNVTEVTLGQGNQRFGAYTQTGNRQWQEIPARGSRRFTFTETNRDDWSVYLHDPSRNVRIQLDLHTKKVMYSDARSARRPLYDIQGSSAKAVQAQPQSPQSPGAPPPQAPAVNGRNVTEVAFGQGNRPVGTYTQTDNRQWQERPAAGGAPRFNFTETNRDDWSVYLHDRSRNVRIQLDLYKKKVMYSDARSARRPLYDIQGTSAKVVQAPPPSSAPTGQTARRPLHFTERNYPGGFLEIRHEGAYLAQFTVTYEIPSGNNSWRKMSWKSGKKPIGYRTTLNFHPGSRNIVVKGTNDTGILIKEFGPAHKNILQKSFRAVPNKCYKVYRTTLHPSNGTCKPDVINSMTRAAKEMGQKYRREIDAALNHLLVLSRISNLQSAAKAAHGRGDFNELSRLIQLDKLTAALRPGQRGDLGGNGFTLAGDGPATVRESLPGRNGLALWRAGPVSEAPVILHSAFEPEASDAAGTPFRNRTELAELDTFGAISWAIAVVDASFGLGGSAELGVVFPNGGPQSPAFYTAASWTVGPSVGADAGMGIGVWRSQVKKVKGKGHGVTGAVTVGGGVAVTFWFGYDANFSGFQVNLSAGFSSEIEYVRGVTEVY